MGLLPQGLGTRQPEAHHLCSTALPFLDTTLRRALHFYLLFFTLPGASFLYPFPSAFTELPGLVFYQWPGHAGDMASAFSHQCP